VVIAVDGDTGAVICDPSFTVMSAGAAVICYPTGDPSEVYGVDGAATCSFRLNSLNGIDVQVLVQVAAPGYMPGLLAIGPCVRDKQYLLPLAPIGDAGALDWDASAYLETNCKVDDTGGGGDCTSLGLHRYVCPASAPAEPPGCIQSGELNPTGIITRCCP
jgi:hypothetical protein